MIVRMGRSRLHGLLYKLSPLACILRRHVLVLKSLGGVTMAPSERLYVALYARGGLSTMPQGEDK